MRNSRAGMFGIPYSAEREKGYSGRVTGIEKFLLRQLLQSFGLSDLRVILWDGKSTVNEDSTLPEAMIIRDRESFWRLLLDPLLYFGDAYSSGSIDIRGNLVDFMARVCSSSAQLRKLPAPPDDTAYLRNQPAAGNSLVGAKKNIQHHYDISNEFYSLWLDEEMAYTCAYFPDSAFSLEAAQLAKMELICRKLDLKAGQTVVEAGCGWGGLARCMARRYGVRVRAFNISGEQVSYAKERARAEKLDRKIEYIEDDYRNITGSFDRFVSVGMLEHVGPDHYQELGRVVYRSLAKHGLGLIHTIGQNSALPMSPWLLKRVFPGSYPPTLREMMKIFEPWEFSILDVENLRLHYARTLEHWLERFERNREKISAMFDECFVRAWRLYLSGSIANFASGQLQLFQVLFAHSSNNLVPLTRIRFHEP